MITKEEVLTAFRLSHQLTLWRWLSLTLPNSLNSLSAKPSADQQPGVVGY